MALSLLYRSYNRRDFIYSTGAAGLTVGATQIDKVKIDQCTIINISNGLQCLEYGIKHKWAGDGILNYQYKLQDHTANLPSDTYQGE